MEHINSEGGTQVVEGLMMGEAFSINFADFLEPGGAFGDLWGHPGPRTSVLDDFLSTFGGSRGHQGDPWGSILGHFSLVVAPGQVKRKFVESFWVVSVFGTVFYGSRVGKTDDFQRARCGFYIVNNEVS